MSVRTILTFLFGMPRLLSVVVARDVTYQAETILPGAYEKLRADLNGTVSRPQNLIKGIVTHRASIRSGSAELSQASDDLIRRIERWATSLAETAEALGEISDAMRKTTQGARHVRDITTTATSDAEHSGAVVRTAVAATSPVEQSAHDFAGSMASSLNEKGPTGSQRRP